LGYGKNDEYLSYLDKVFNKLVGNTLIDWCKNFGNPIGIDWIAQKEVTDG